MASSPNIAVRFYEMARQQPDRLALFIPQQRDRQKQHWFYRPWTYRQLALETDRVARSLATFGIKRGMHTALFVKPGRDFFTVTFALFQIGAIPIFIDPGMGLPLLGKCLDQSAPRALIAIPRAQAASLLFGWGRRTIRLRITVGPIRFGSGPTLRHLEERTLRRDQKERQLLLTNVENKTFPASALSNLINPPIQAPLPTAVQTDLATGVPGDTDDTEMPELSLEQLAQTYEILAQENGKPAPASHSFKFPADPWPRRPVAELQADDTAAMLFTTGSTGPPKGVLYTHGMFNQQVDLLRDVYGIMPGEVDMPTFPLFGLFGLALGMTSVLPVMDFTRPAKVDPDEILQPIQDFGVTNLFGSPALLRRVGQYAAQRQVALPSLKRVLCAGAPVPAPVLERFDRILAPGVQVHTPYGATEALPVTTMGSREILDDTRSHTDDGKGTCVGRPVAGLELVIIRLTDEPIFDWAEDLRVPVGEIGEIAVAGPQVSAAYWRDERANRLAKIADSANKRFFHRMGDVGYLDEHGRLWFCGRKNHRVQTGTKTYFTIPVEAIFNTHPDVFRTALVGVELDGTTEPVLCVELESFAQNKSVTTLRTELHQLGQNYPHTADIKTFLFHPGFPVDIRHNAKIFREKLAIWATGQLLSNTRAAAQKNR